MHRDIRYTKTVQPAKTRHRRVWKPDSSNSKTIGTKNREFCSNKDNNNNNTSDTRRFITKKYTAPSHEHRHEGDDQKIDRYYEDDCEFEEDYIYDEDAGFENEYFDEDVNAYNNDDDDDVIYIKESYGNERVGRYFDKDGLNGDKNSRYDDKDVRYSDRDGRYDDRDGRYDDRDGRCEDGYGRYGDRDHRCNDRDGRYGDRDSRYDDRNGRCDDRDGRYGDKDGRYGDRDGRYGDKDGRYGDRDGRYGDRDGRYGDRDGRYGDIGGRYDVKDGCNDHIDNRYADRDSHYSDKHGRYNVKGGRHDERDRYCDGERYNGNNNSNFERHNNGIEKYEREFFSSTVRKRNRNSLHKADAADIRKKDVRSRLGPRSPVEHEEENLDVDVGYDDSYIDEPQVIYNHLTSPQNLPSRNRLDSSENYRYGGNVDNESHQVEHVEDRIGTYTTSVNQDKRVTKALLDEFGVSITDIADYLRRQIAEKENNGNLTLNQLLEEKFVKNKSTTGVVTPHGNTDTPSTSSGSKKKRSISPELISTGGSSKRDESKRKSESATRKAESSIVKYNSHTNKSLTSSPHSDWTEKSHSTRRRTRPSEKDYGKRSRSPDGKYHTIQLKDSERKSNYSPDRKSHRTHLSSSERESSELKKRWSYDEHQGNIKAKKTSTSSIEAFLINAGNQGVNEFKKQQASQFIASKLQTTAHYQTLKPAIVFPVAPLVIPQHHVMVATPPAPNNPPPIMSPVFIPISTPSDFLPLDTKNDMPKKQNIGAIERNTKEKQTETKTSKASTSSSINETLSLLRKSSGSTHPQETCDINESICDEENEEDTNRDADDDNKTNNNDEKNSSSDDEVSITRVVEPRKNSKKTVIQPVVAPTEPKERLPTASITNGLNRKVFLEDKTDKTTTPSESNSTNVTTANGKEISPRTRVRVPSWFNARLVELFKKHKKVHQLKRAKQNPSGIANNSNRVKELQESLREIDRQYIPLCHKTKGEFIKNGGMSSNSSRTKHEIAVLGFDESIPDIDGPVLI